MENNRTLITYEKCLDIPIIINSKFKNFLLYSKKYIISTNDNNYEYSLIIKIYYNIFYFILLKNNKENSNNNKNIYFYENKFDLYEIKKIFCEEKENKTFDEIIKIINREISTKNIEIINDIENKIKIFFKKFNNKYIELIKIELYQKNKSHNELINRDYISNTIINPNLIYKDTIIKNSLLFEVYYPFDNPDEIYIIYQNNKNLNLVLFNLTKLNIISYLNSISEKTTLIKHFFNPKNSYDYLCASDIKKIIYVYNLTLNCNLLYKIKTYYSFNIFSCLLFFDNKNNNNYLITSTYAINGDNYTKAYTLEEGHFIKNYPLTNENSTSSLLYWFHKKLKGNYIIELCSEKIFIYQMITNGFYAKFDINNNEFLHGCILESGDINEFLYCSTYNNSIYVFDLYKKKLNRIINLWNKIEKNNNIYDIIKWSNKYIIISNYNGNSIDIVDIEQNKIINSLKDRDKAHVLTLKKIIHPIFGEALLSSSDNSTIKLWD